MTGLKYFNQRYKGCWPHRKLRFLFRELKYAWQRAWKGYDDSAVYAFSYVFRDWVISVLQEKVDIMRINEDCCWPPNPDMKTSYAITRQKMRPEIESLVADMRMTDMDYVAEQILGEDWFTEKTKIEDWENVYNIYKDHCSKAFTKLCDLFNYL